MRNREKVLFLIIRCTSQHQQTICHFSSSLVDWESRGPHRMEFQICSWPSYYKSNLLKDRSRSILCLIGHPFLLARNFVVLCLGAIFVNPQDTLTHSPSGSWIWIPRTPQGIPATLGSRSALHLSSSLSLWRRVYSTPIFLWCSLCWDGQVCVRCCIHSQIVIGYSCYFSR